MGHLHRAVSVVVAVASLVGLGASAPGAGATAPTGAAVVRAAPAPPPPGSPGCRGGDPRRLTGTVTSRGVPRRYEWHLPAHHDPRRPLPVILAFHGKGMTIQGMRTLSGLDVADALVLYPGSRLARGVPAWEGTRDLPVDGVDVAFVADLLAEAGRQVCTDPRRVHATGASQGGGFSDVLACSSPGLLAAIAPVAGAFYRPTAGGVRDCRSGPLRVLEIHGDADTVMPYAGSERSRPLREWLAGWTARDRCPPVPASRPLGADVQELRWTACAAGTEVRHFLVRGGNHAWPGGPSPAIAGPGRRTDTISATREVLAFFGITAARA